MTRWLTRAGTIRRVGLTRQFLAATVLVPPSVAEHLNMNAMAVLAVIRNEAEATGRCTLPVARIAQLANVGRAKARTVIRLAESLGLIATGVGSRKQLGVQLSAGCLFEC
jgi:hypothetical protein